MKVVIFGIGFLGGKLFTSLSKEFKVIGATLNPKQSFIRKVDASNRKEVEDFLISIKPDIVINTISLSSYFNAKSILLSGVKLTGLYAKFLEGKKLVFENALKNKTKIFSLDGILGTKTAFDEWCKF